MRVQLKIESDDYIDLTLSAISVVQTCKGSFAGDGLRVFEPASTGSGQGWQ